MKTTLSSIFYKFDQYSNFLMRLALAIVFFWFGFLKILGLSPAQELVENTILWLPPSFFVPFLGVWEMGIGVGLLFKKWVPYIILLLLLHMVGTFLPLLVVPNVCFNAPLCPSLIGQYIIKNLVFIACALTIASSYAAEKKAKTSFKSSLNNT